jgi:hypothetical protein
MGQSKSRARKRMQTGKSRQRFSKPLKTKESQIRLIKKIRIKKSSKISFFVLISAKKPR